MTATISSVCLSDPITSVAINSIRASIPHGSSTLCKVIENNEFDVIDTFVIRRLLSRDMYVCSYTLKLIWDIIILTSY